MWFSAIILNDCPMFLSDIFGSSELILDRNPIAIYGASNAQWLSKCPTGLASWHAVVG
jgi:hypothetical protein